MKSILLAAAALAATATVATSAQSATVVATLVGQAPYGGEYLHFGPGSASGLGLSGTGKEALTFTAGIGPLIATDVISGFSSTAATVSGGTYSQGGFSGTYDEIFAGPSGGTTVVDGVSLTKGVTSLLSGNFTNGVVTITGNKGTFQFDATYTTPFNGASPIDAALPATGHFIDHFNVIHGVIQIQRTGFLHSFDGNSQDGTYFGAVPEPAAWALMLVGFGGIGVAMRRRKAAAAAV